MAKKLESFPSDETPEPRRYPWHQWTDGSVWEIRRLEDYDVDTENMRVNLHIRADSQTLKVRTKKVIDEHGEGLIFQFFDNPDGQEASKLLATVDKTDVD